MALNIQNLIVPTSEQARINGRKGGLASVEAKKRRKTLREELKIALEETRTITDKKGERITKTNQEWVTASLVNQAMKGNTKAYEIIRDGMGENPVYGESGNEQEEKRPIYMPAKDIGKAFVDLNRYIDDRAYYEYWLEGGRGSVKSSYWSEKVAELLENNENMCALIIRKVGNTLKDSVYSQMLWGIDKLSETYPEVKSHWKERKSPLEIQNTKTGQKIYFRGADDPMKIKSIRPPKGKYIGIVVYEEFDQMNGMNEVGTIDRSVIRGGEDFIVFRVYNTPVSSQHFVNKEKRIPKADRLVHRSTYLDVPRQWLGSKFFEEAEYMKSINERNYENVYLGELEETYLKT